MAIIKHIAVHSSPLNFLKYIMNGDKTDNAELVSGMNCTEDVKSAYDEFAFVFEGFSGERFYKRSHDNNSGRKEKIRLHHYIQSFSPGEVTPEEAHNIGWEWARRVFGSERQVIITTHRDKDHIHNHFAVAAYDLDGKRWYANKTTLKHCREISDKVCKFHGLSIIEKPQYKAEHKYSDWLARQTGTSWKQRLCDDIDRLVLRRDVQSVTDLAYKLAEKGYVVNIGKYMSVAPSAKRKAIRTYRLGDGYAMEELNYRIQHKNQEMSLSTVALYQGIQREYAMCLRELQIMFYRREEMPHKATYAEVRKNSELLMFLCANKIQSVSDFENLVNDTADKADKLRKKHDELLQSIEEYEKIVENGARYLELKRKWCLDTKQEKEMDKLRYLDKYEIYSEHGIAYYGRKLEESRSELAETEKSLADAEMAKAEAGGNYQTYLRQMQTDYDFIFEKMKHEQEEIKRAEQERQREQQRQSKPTRQSWAR